MNALAPDTKFLFFPQLNQVEDDSWLNSKSTFGPPQYENFFSGETLQGKFLKELATAQLLPIKEVLECFEYFAQIRKHVRAEVMADLCCGHGLLGVIFAMFEKSVDKVYLVDMVEPPSRQHLIELAISVAPWIEAKIVNVSERISVESEWLEEGMAIVSAHACGSLTDLCLDIACETKGNVAILPCCYPKKKCSAPLALQNNLGFELAFDVERTYKLERAGYHIRWQSIPAAISPMNRVVIGKKKS
ncbi:MAG: SAM-dependent methyltransferase [Lentisphaerales bacterium]|nr:SAM-dependent methyltransferase [Lentisphaerales bacterium]